MKEGRVLEYFINNQKKSKKQIADDLGMSRRNLYELFSSTTLKHETKERFESYFNIKIFTEENKNLAEQQYGGETKEASQAVKEASHTYTPGLDFREKYVSQLEQHNQDLRYTVETQKKLIEKLEYELKPSKNNEQKEVTKG